MPQLSINPIMENATYARRKRLLAKIYKFNFRNTKHFSQQQKALITRTWNKYKYVLKRMERGQATFKQANRKQIRALGDRFEHTNKGIIIQEKIDTVKIIGKGKETVLKITRGLRRELFVPLRPGQLITELIEWVWENLKPRFVLLAIGKWRGNTAMNKYKSEGYTGELEDIVDKALDEYGTQPYTGVYAVWIDGTLQRKVNPI